jgi:lactate permease
MATTLVPAATLVKMPAKPPAPPRATFFASALVIVIAAIAALAILRISPVRSPWAQGYDPTGHWWLSTILAALPIIVLLGSPALGHVKAHYAALADWRQPCSPPFLPSTCP